MEEMSIFTKIMYHSNRIFSLQSKLDRSKDVAVRNKAVQLRDLYFAYELTRDANVSDWTPEEMELVEAIRVNCNNLQRFHPSVYGG